VIGENQHRNPAVALKHEDGSWRVHTDPKGDPKMAAHFAKALTRLRETVCVWRGHDFVWGEPFGGSLTVKGKTYREQEGQCSRCGEPAERSIGADFGRTGDTDAR
jgi:hypothetical protein